MSRAGDRLQAAAIGAVGGVQGLNGAYPGVPLRASRPFAQVEASIETDWSHKSGRGREVRLAVTLRDGGERPARIEALAAAAEAAIEALPRELEGWRLVSLGFLRTRTVQEAKAQGWAAVIQYRARMLEIPA